VKTDGGVPVYLRDVAKVRNSVADERHQHALLGARLPTFRARP
jgi:Cu/Ag efflux pump CusA